MDRNATVDPQEVRRLVYGSETFQAEVSLLQDIVDGMARRERAGEVISGDDALFLYACKVVLAKVEAGRPVDRQASLPA